MTKTMFAKNLIDNIYAEKQYCRMLKYLWKIRFLLPLVVFLSCSSSGIVKDQKSPTTKSVSPPKDFESPMKAIEQSMVNSDQSFNRLPKKSPLESKQWRSRSTGPRAVSVVDRGDLGRGAQRRR